MRWWPRDLLELMAPFHLTMWMIVVGGRQVRTLLKFNHEQ